MARIRIVDDSPTENFSIGSLLGRQGQDGIAAESGEEGIRLAREQRPDLILMDIVMPGLNGFQATRQLTRDPQTAMIPIVILTSKSQDTDRVWAERQGAKGYLTKPVEEAVLLSTITHVLGGMQR